MQNSDFYHNIAELCLKTFNRLPKSGKPIENQWTVLSCIVQESDTNFETVALGTGSKCIGEVKMSEKGDILNDSHAEIICRRVFLRYLYQELIKSFAINSDVFGYNSDKKKFHLKNVRFHFFTTLVPCGDASIFRKHDLDHFGSILKGSQDSTYCKNNLKRGGDLNNDNTKKLKADDNVDIFRTGAKCLQNASRQDPHEKGDNYHITGVVRTKPGRGDPTLSVSCSDKLAKWCFVGIQGALLTILLDAPVYLTSFTICGGTPFCRSSLERALYSRFDDINLISPYVKTKMVVAQANIEFPFQKSEKRKPSPTSMAWFKSLECSSVEVAVDGKRQGVTKKKINTELGRLKICKLELFKNFRNVVELIDLDFGIDLKALQYFMCKQIAGEYQKMWTVVKQGFKLWPIKDNVLLEFHCE